MYIDVIRAPIGQCTIQQPLHVRAIAYIAQIVDAHIICIVDTHRDQPMSHNLGNYAHLLEGLQGSACKNIGLGVQ